MRNSRHGSPSENLALAKAKRERRQRIATRRATGQTWFNTGARLNQRPPGGDWTIWLLLAGRGFGKTRTIVEWAHERAMAQPRSRGAIIAATAYDVREVLVDGESGFLNVIPPLERPIYKSSGRRAGLLWPNGSRALLYTAEKPDRLRGPQFHWAICDEYAAWRYPQALDMLTFGLRLGDDPRMVIATTPRPTPQVKALLKEEHLVLTRGRTDDNAANLAPQFLERIVGKYKGTRLGRQELDGDILDDVEGALWNYKMLDALRVNEDPELNRIVIGLDPKISSQAASEAGIVAVGKGENGHGYVLWDGSLDGTPKEWATKAITLYHTLRANAIVVETNQGGEMAKTILNEIDDTVPIVEVHASTGKQARAEPVQLLYEQGRMHHVGTWAKLEDQMCSWAPIGNMPSPDRLDALVWATTEVMLEEDMTVRVRSRRRAA